MPDLEHGFSSTLVLTFSSFFLDSRVFQETPFSFELTVGTGLHNSIYTGGQNELLLEEEEQ